MSRILGPSDDLDRGPASVRTPIHHDEVDQVAVRTPVDEIDHGVDDTNERNALKRLAPIPN
jgi:hypothetical protein